MKTIKPLFYSFSFLVMILLLLSNAAQPGICNAGGGGYHLLFPEDSLNFKKIQMHSEKISMQLYPGFAIVKGEYQMKNDTKDTISIKVGYPVNGIYEGNHFGKMNLVTFDGLYKIKTLQDGELLPILEKPVKAKQDNSEAFNNENWYLWENTFLPNQTTAIEVYFMVNTNNAFIRKGYNKDNHNAFIYLLESGNVWKQPITNANFRIELKDGLTLEDIHGISQSVSWKKSQKTDSNVLLASKVNFSPTPKDNIVINYGNKIDDFDFQVYTKKEDYYFDEINRFSKLNIENVSEFTSKNPYDVSSTGIFGLLIRLFFIIPGILVMVLIYFISKYVMLKKYGLDKNKNKAFAFHVLGLIFSLVSLIFVSIWAYFTSLIVAVPALILGILFTVNAQKSWRINTFTKINYVLILISIIIGLISLLVTK